ncbi:MAG TPA: LLM class flavin-dependent oxidoreductase [Acidimicrobiales bacterium]|nr:LLM class flavin-dependent oxidoreductase [Acidimicrobiales bacterium]
MSSTSDAPLSVSVRIRYADAKALAALVAEAEDLGLDGVWVNEPWGFDAGAVLGWVAASTRRMWLGTHVLSIYARTPAATAGLAAALHSLSEGRFRLGLGTSGPQVVEGWHGVPFDRPLARTRDTVEIVRRALSGEPVSHDGDVVTLPLPDSRGRALRFSQLGEPMHVPIYLGALGPKNQQLTAELADGWTPTPYSPDSHSAFAGDLEAALDRTHRRADVRLAPVVPVAVGDDVNALLDLERRWSAFYLGGMGSKEQNFYAAAARRTGHGPMVDRITERWQAGDRRGAKAAVTDEYADSVGLYGPPERIAERADRYRAAGIDELVIELRKPDLGDQLDDLRLFWKALTS